MGSVCNIKVTASDAETANRFVNRVARQFQLNDERWSLYRETSLIKEINQRAHTEPIALDSITEDIIRRAFQYTEETNGYFNVLVYPLLVHYGFYPAMNTLPTSVDSALKLMRMEDVEIVEGRIRFKQPGMGITLDGLAVGYTLRQIKALFQDDPDVNDLFINHSGDILYLNRVSNDSIAIEINHYNRVKRIIYIKPNEAVSSSGNYAFYQIFFKDTLGHIINPKTGEAGKLRRYSTIIGTDPLKADVYSTISVLTQPDSIWRLSEDDHTRSLKSGQRPF